MNRRFEIRRQSGFTLIELLIATLIVAAFLVPAMQTLDVLTHTSTGIGLQAERDRVVEARMNAVLALPFTTLAANAAGNNTPGVYSDPPTTDPRVVVMIARFDGDSTGSPVTFFDVNNVDPDLLWVRVALADTDNGLATLVFNK